MEMANPPRPQARKSWPRRSSGAWKDGNMALRYPVGKDARFFPIAQRFMPDWIYDRVMNYTLERFQAVKNG